MSEQNRNKPEPEDAESEIIAHMGRERVLAVDAEIIGDGGVEPEFLVIQPMPSRLAPFFVQQFFDEAVDLLKKDHSRFRSSRRG